jgi:AcrR family transcriptional regulator
MGRWAPDAPSRLAQAALELFGERGYENSTVAEIAERAGLTERTFFRHFSDKREVLFWGAGELQAFLVDGVDGAARSLTPIEAVVAALDAAAAGFFEERRQQSRQRQAVIVANTELQERELIKLASLASAIAEALRRRGVGDPAASLAAEAGIAVFKIAFAAWTDEAGERTLSELIGQSVSELQLVTGPRPAAKLKASKSAGRSL